MRLKLSFTMMMLMALASSAGAAPICQDLFNQHAEERLAALSPALVNSLATVKRLSPALVAGETQPTWNDFYDLKKLVSEVRKAKTELQDPALLRELDDILSQLARSEDPRLDRLHTTVRDFKPQAYYKPTEYEMKLLFRYELAKLNRELPRGARLPFQKLPFDQRRKSFVADAHSLMTSLRASVSSRFKTTGFETYADYERAIRNSEDPLTKRAIELIDSEQIEMVIRRPEQARFWIPKVGFHNQYVTGTSKGTNSPARRREAETRLYALHDGVTNVQEAIADYTKRDPELAPKYGTLMAKRETNLRWDSPFSVGYGSDVYVLKKANIENRTTFTFSDSLVHGWKQSPISHWDTTFIPWDQRLLMVESMKAGLAENKFGTPDGGSSLKHTLNPYYYWEIQILGPLKLSDVSELHFTSTEPRGKFLLELLKANVKVFDARASAPGIEWIPDAAAIEAAHRDQNP